MKIQSKVLLSDLKKMTLQNMEAVKAYLNCSISSLNYKINNESWSVLECLEHLNRYGDFYIPEITSRIKNAQKPSSEHFKSGWLGNYFANSMMPAAATRNMKTFKVMNPAGSQLDMSTIHKFLEQQQSLLSLLDKAQSVHLHHTKTSISISSFIKLRLGDTFRVVIYHNLRHVQQAGRALRNFQALNCSAV